MHPAISARLKRLVPVSRLCPYLDFDFDTRMRARYRITRGRVNRYIVQLEVRAAGKWRHAVRYDTPHRFAHRDLYRTRGRAVKSDLKMTFEEALTYALDDLRENWESYREQFLGE